MSDMEMNKLIETVSQKEEYAERITDCKTPDELITLLKEVDVIITEEEAIDAIAITKDKLEKDELDEEDLELVSGGFWGIIPALKGIGLVLGGVGAAALIGGIVVMVLYSRSKKR